MHRYAILFCLGHTFGHAIEFMRDFDVQAIAATYMAIAMRLYKTHLDENEYKMMIKTELGKVG